MPTPLPFLGALGAFVALSSASPATAPWSPAAVVRTGRDLGLIAAASGASGASLVAGDGRSGSFLVPVTADGGPGRSLTAPGVLAVGAYADRSVLLRRSRDSRRVTVSFGDLGARDLGGERLLHRGAPADAQLAVGAGGQTLVVLGTGGGWDGVEFDDERVRLSWSVDADHRRWRSRTLPGRTEVLDAAVDARGTAVLLLQRPDGPDYRVTARTLGLRDGDLGPERTLDHTHRDWLQGTVATNARGDAVLAWGGQDGGEEAGTPYVVRAALRRTGTTRFRPTQTLDGGRLHERPGGYPAAAVDAAGNATVAWSQAVGWGVSVPRTATAPPGGRFRGRTTLLRTGVVTDAVATGTTTAVGVTGSRAPYDGDWDTEPPRWDVGGVVVRQGPGPFGRVEDLGGTTPDDVAAPQLTAGPTGFRALWDGVAADGRDALRWSRRAAG